MGLPRLRRKPRARIDGAWRVSLDQGMLDVLDAALYDPASGTVYFFRGGSYVAYQPGRGVVPLGDGRLVRRLGIDGWQALPDEFRGGIDAALDYPPDGAVHFFRGASYVVYAAAGPVARSDGRIVRRLGIDGWQALPATFRDGIDTALHDRSRGRTYFFRGEQYVEYESAPGTAVVRALRDGFALGSFAGGVDAVLDYPPSGRRYFFRGRDYVRCDADGGVEPRYPARIGRPYGRGLVGGKGGGWLGLSCLIAGPMVGLALPTSVTIWAWTVDRATAERLRLRIEGASRAPVVRDLVDPQLRGGLDRVYAGSQVVALVLDALAPGRSYDAELTLGDDGPVLDRVAFRTALPPANHGAVELVIGSCADHPSHADMPVFEGMAARRADVALLLGDNCYYVNRLGSSSNSPWLGGWIAAEWDDPRRMLLRQLAARNLPQFAALARTTNMHATWDDHDFGYNNSAGHDACTWAGREVSSTIFRAMWPAPYAAEDGRSIYHTFRTGPVEVFVTDTRYEKDHRTPVILGAAQLGWLIERLAASDAPVKVVVLSSQFLYRPKEESFLSEAPGEHAAILEALGLGASPGTVRGRVLLISGDVHYSELLRAPTTGAPKVLEFTSSSIRTGEQGNPMVEWVSGSQIWAVQRDSFGVISVDVRGCRGDIVDGTIAIEARDAAGEVLTVEGRPCRTVWNLADGTLGA
jgi:alkaline phosphatase D